MKLEDRQLQISATDMSDFLACRHLTRRSIRVANGELERPYAHDAGFDALVERGRRHEADVLDRFKIEVSADVLELDPFGRGLDSANAATLDAIARGKDIIYQGVLRTGHELGLPDFLVRAELLGSSHPGYEVVDAKLARTAKARAVLQTTFYSRLLGDVQGHEPVTMYLALGARDELDAYRVKDFAAYERQVAKMLGEFVDGDGDPYPDPVEHCSICRWRAACAARRREDDYLSLVAGITAKQRTALVTAGIHTLEAFGDLDEPPRIDGVGRDGLANVHAQARIQLRGRRSGEPEWEFRAVPRDDDGEPTPNLGLLGLPKPAHGDLFFDIEGARFYSEDDKTFGLQYLFGIVDTSTTDTDGRPAYRAIWSFDRAGEKVGFEKLVDFFTSNLADHPCAHIYHYNHYEPTTIDALSTMHDTMHDAVGVLMGRLGTREDELDDLFRMGAFVDLYRIVRQSISASVESYSIKRLEPLIGYERAVDLADVNERMVGFDAALEDGTAEADVETREIIRGYNEDDCRATLELRAWLEARRADLEGELGRDLPRPTPPEPPIDHEDPAIAALYAALKLGLPDDPSERTPTQAARSLAADLLGWHRREDKPRWWHYFWLRGLTDAELLEDDDALAGLQMVEVVATRKKLRDVRLSFPPQEHGIKAGSSAFDGRSIDPFPRENAITEVDEAAHTIVVTVPIEGDLPTVLLPNPTFRAPAQRSRLRRLGERVLELGDTTWPNDAALDLLLGRHPRAGQGRGEPLASPEEEAASAGERLVLELDSSYLPVQGPPGTGKTYMGARMVVALTMAGRKVGVTANSHAVVDNLLAQVVQVADALRMSIPRIGQRVDESYEAIYASASSRGRAYTNTGQALADLSDDVIDVLGGTPWVWASDAAEGAVDTLIVDEAGQVSLANTLAVAAAGRNLVLLGDPLQLAQPSQAAHPLGAGASSLEHVLGDARVMPPERGLFIGVTRRMHPDLCAFTSDTFYEGLLHGIDGLERQTVGGPEPFNGSGVRYVPVVHEGNTSSSPEEAAVVAQILESLVGQPWTSAQGEVTRITPRDVLVVTPFNDQIEAIETALSAANRDGVLVGTVDKFQGREAPVTVYSLATSSAEDAPRGMEFLYQLNRLNVATSRARCISIIVASPDLAAVLCKTPRQMLLANAMCSAVEHAAPTRSAGTARRS